MALFWTAVILFFCLEKASNIPVLAIPNIDKVIHAVFHFGFTSLWFLYIKKAWNNTNDFRLLVISFIGSFVFGVAIEFMQQYFTDTRSADVFDVLANMTGSFFAIISILVLNKYSGILGKI